MIFLPPFLDVTRVSMSIVFFPRTARLWKFLPIESFSLKYDLSGLKYRIRFFLNRFPVYFNLFVLLFLVTPCLVVAAEPCIKGILINKKTSPLLGNILGYFGLRLHVLRMVLIFLVKFCVTLLCITLTIAR